MNNRQSQLRILQIFKYYHPHIGGVEKVAQDIAEGLKDRIATTVLTTCDGFSSSEEKINRIHVVRAGAPRTYFSVPLAPAFPFLMRQLARRSDILHFHLPYPLADASWLLARPKGKVVVWWHSEIVRPKKLTKLYTPLLVRFLKHVDRIIVAAPQLRDNSPILRQFADKCEVVPIGVDPARFAANEAGRKRAEDIKKRYGRPIVLFAGRLIYYKGAEYLIRAMKHNDAVLLIIGDGPLKGELEELASRVGIRERIVFLGRVTDEEMVDYYQACDLFVLPSVANTEAFGIVQLEAMACGKPVISTDLPTGVPFVNLDCVTGLIVPPRDSEALGKAIQTLLDDEALRARLGRAGRRRVEEQFTRKKMLDRVYSIYEEVIRGTSPR